MGDTATSASAPERARRREDVVREHMASENELRFEDTLATFAHPRYELIGSGQVYDGADAVMEYYARSRAVFPDQRNEVRAIHDAGRTVIVEFDLLGTHLGSLTGEEPTGRAFRCPMVALFEFGAADEAGGEVVHGEPETADKIVCERVYFDVETIYRQLRGEPGPSGADGTGR